MRSPLLHRLDRHLSASRTLQWRKLLGEMAACEVVRAHFAQLRRLAAAAVFGEPAAWMEVAAGWRCGRAWYLALEDRIIGCNARIGNWDGAYQRRGIGMTGTREDGVGRRQFNELTNIHDGDAVANVAHHGKIVSHQAAAGVGCAFAACSARIVARTFG